MIIALNGYIGAGKDEVARMISFLMWRKRAKESTHDISLDEYFKISHHHTFDDLSLWQIRKFAYKLKQMASLLTGIPVEDLEKQEVKARELGPEWDKQLIGDSFIGTYQSFLELCKDPNVRPSLESPVRINQYDSMYRFHWIVKHLTVRELLQKLGTNAVRDQLHPNAWVNALMVDYLPIGGMPNFEEDKKFMAKLLKYPNWVISDCRFENEAQAIKDRGGVIWRINRPGKIMVSKGGGSILVEEKFDPTDIQHVALLKADSLRKHSSETSLDNWNFDRTIENDGSLEELLTKVLEALKEGGFL